MSPSSVRISLEAFPHFGIFTIQSTTDPDAKSGLGFYGRGVSGNQVYFFLEEVRRTGFMEGKQAWQAALGQLQLEMPKAAFDTWVRDAELISVTDGDFQIGVHNAYARDWLDSRLKSTITKLLNGTMNRPVDITFVINNGAKKPTSQDQLEMLDSPQVETPRVENSPPQRVSINFRYNFNNFVVGSQQPSGSRCFSGCF